MSEIKVNASFMLPGSVLPAEPPCSKNGKKKKKKEEKEEILYQKEVIRLKNQAPIVINLRVAKPVTQNMHLTKEAYSYMISAENPAKGQKLFDWKRLSNRKRLKAHLQNIASSIGGVLVDFVVLED